MMAVTAKMIDEVLDGGWFASGEQGEQERSITESCKQLVASGAQLSPKQADQIRKYHGRKRPVAYAGHRRNKPADGLPAGITDETVDYDALQAESVSQQEDDEGVVFIKGIPVDCSVSLTFMRSKLHPPSVLLDKIPEEFRPRPITKGSNYPNGRFEYPYPSEDIMGGPMVAVRNNTVGSTVAEPIRFYTPGRARVGDRSNAPYLPPPQDDSGHIVQYEGQGKILCGYSHGQNTIGTAGAWNFRKGGEKEDPNRADLNPMIVKYFSKYKVKSLTIVPDPNAFTRADIGTAYVEYCQKLKVQFGKQLTIKIYKLPDAIDDLTDKVGEENPQIVGESAEDWGRRCFDIAWNMGEHVPIAAIKCALIRVADDPCFPHPLKVKQLKDGSRHVAFHEINAALILQHHPRMTGRIRFDMSHGVFHIDGEAMKDLPASLARIGHDLAYDVLWDYNGTVLEYAKLKTTVAGMTDSVGFYPMQELVKTLPKWDGMPRMAELGVRYCGLEDSTWSRLWMESFILYTMRRGLRPGTVCRILWLLKGAQVIGKSTLPITIFGEGMAGIIGDLTSGGQVDFDELLRRLYQTGHTAVLDDIETIPIKYRSMLKQLIAAGSRMAPEQVRYLHIGEKMRTRHFTIFATTNSEAVIPDDLTGNFRICAVQSLNAARQKFDFAGIAAVREQVLAEAYERVMGMSDSDWSDYEDRVTAEVEEGSAWAVAENSNYTDYAVGLKDHLKLVTNHKLVDDPAHEICPLSGTYNGKTVVAIKLASLQAAIKSRNNMVYMKDLENWLKSEGWVYSPTEVVRRRRVWFKVGEDA